MRLALAQINPTIGDLAGNADIIERFCAQAHAARADLVVFPELSLTGYPPKDLLWQQGFVEAAGAIAKGRLRDATRKWPGLTVIIGAPLPLDPAGKRLSNSLLVYRDGVLVNFYDKRLLPTYDVFDENRYFTPGDRSVVIDVAGVPVGLSICEDLWRGLDAGYPERYLDHADPVADLCDPPADAGRPAARLIINPSASPFVLGKGQRHRAILKHHARERGVFVAAVNQVGGNDELIFDGHAAVYAPGGALMAAAPGFVEHLLVVDVPVNEAVPLAPTATGEDPLLAAGDEAMLFAALTLGVRDYCRKTGFKSAVLGLSGGIDSAVVAVIAAAALGPASITGVSMPSRYSSAGSKSDAHTLARALGIACLDLPIEEIFPAFEHTLARAFAGTAPGIAEENIQSRIRGSLLMALSNKFNHLLLTTGNKSELAVGYCTLYGDMNGGLAVISDVGKIMVYRLARWINQHVAALGIPGLNAPPIPEASITKPPSAELRPDQTDQDSLPPYHILDEIIERYVEQRQDPASIVKDAGIDPATVARIVRLIDLSEYKRKQAAIGLKVTGVAFGSGRRMPIAQGWRPERGLR
jgi:NAD+ synthase (glutamine-hydrolysing)